MSGRTPGGADSARGIYLAVSAVVALLALALLGLLGLFWGAVLEPRLRVEAESQADILAQSQAARLGAALASPAGAGGGSGGAERVRATVATLDELLLLRDPQTRTPYFESVELQVDYDAVDAVEGSLDLRRGSREPGGFRSEVPIYDPASAELLGIAWFQVSDRFYQQLAGDLRRGMGAVLLGGLGLLAALWWVLVALLRKLQRQSAGRHRAERELSQQEQKYHRLVENLSNYFVYGRDAAGEVTFLSDSARGVLGETRAGERLGAALRAAAATAGSAAGVGGRGERVFEVEVPDADGVAHHLEVAEVAVLDEKGAPAGFDGIARDVTAARLVQEELRLAKDQAEAANRAKSQFLANMSHEIRTPLNAIVGMTALALKAEVPPRVRDFLGKIRGSAHLLAEIIEDILDLSRIEAGRLQIQRVDFDLDELLAELADVVGVRVGDKELEVLFSTAPDVPRLLRGDPVRLQQVLLNLVGNALKFTSAGEVVVEIAVAEARRERVELRFVVRDTGIGIPREHLDSLFQPFTQVDGSMTRRFGGAGLGLAISQRLVDLMGGELQVESAPGQGSTFSFTGTFELPRGAAGPRRLAEEFHELPVLVADDNPSARVVLSTMLQSLSCRVTAVGSGEEAVAAARRAAAEGHPYRLAVLDWKMPGIDGAETAARLAEGAAAAAPAVILVTAYDREAATKRAELAGIEMVLHKPVSPSTLHDAVVRVLDPRTAGGGPARVPEQRFAPGQRVLLVEDNAINREVARELLTLAGLRVVEAHNGIQALRTLDADSAFDAVLMDVQMPELDGIETVHAMRQQPRLAALPVVAMTAHAMLGDRERFLAAGMSDYVAKPIEERELLRVLARWLRTEGGGEPPRRPRAAGARGDLVTTGAAGADALDVAEGVRRTSGNAALYRRLVSELASECGEAPGRVADLLAKGDTEAALAVLHTVKGSAATLGAQRVAGEAAALEAALRGGGAVPSTAALATAIDELRDLVARLPAAPPATAAAAAGTNGSGTDGARAAALPLVERLRELLPRNDLGALDLYQELARLLDPADGGAVAALGEALDRLDFAGAAHHLERLAAELAPAAEAP